MPQFDCVHCTKRISVMILDDLENTRSAEPVKRLGMRVPIPKLREIQSEAGRVLYVIWELAKIVSGRPDEIERLHRP
jgi:hypothetical protein